MWIGELEAPRQPHSISQERGKEPGSNENARCLRLFCFIYLGLPSFLQLLSVFETLTFCYFVDKATVDVLVFLGRALGYQGP